MTSGNSRPNSVLLAPRPVVY